MKYDGYRTLVAVGAGEARAYTRSGLDWSDRFPSILSEAGKLNVRSALIDGEAVALDAEGRSSFQALQGALKGAPATIDYFAFDLLELDGEDLTGLPLLGRKAKLKAILPAKSIHIHFSEHTQGNGEKLLKSFCAAGLEGVVSKLATSKYIGARAGSWVKTKCIKRQEFVIVGWTPSDKSRAFRSLILGVHEGGKLRYAGKVGTGFDTAELAHLMAIMAPLEQKTATVDAPRAEVRGAHGLRPRLVAEIAYTEMTNDGTLRHPSYLGLRDDKKPEAIALETEHHAVDLPAPATSSVVISSRERLMYPESAYGGGEMGSLVTLDEAGSDAAELLEGRYERLCCLGSAAGRSAWSGARRAGPRKCFFQKHDAGGFSDRVHHIGVVEKDGDEEPYLYVDDADGLMTCVQMGTIEFHGWGARIEDTRRPTGWSSTSILTWAWILRRSARPPSNCATS
jgi:bifunctional non-homologous end joining protein LigD